MARDARRGLGATIGVLAFVSALSPAGPGSTTPPNGDCPTSTVSTVAAASVVGVLVSGAGRPQTATGFVIGDHRVLTVAHAVLASAHVTVTQSGTTVALAATVVGLDSRRDLAVLDIPGLRLGALHPADGRPVVTSCATVLTVRGGRVVPVDAVVRRSVEVSIDAPVDARRSALELAAGIRRGDSGSAVLDRSGRVEGVIFAASRDGSSTGWAVDVSELRGFLDAALQAR